MIGVIVLAILVMLGAIIITEKTGIKLSFTVMGSFNLMLLTVFIRRSTRQCHLASCSISVLVSENEKFLNLVM